MRAAIRVLAGLVFLILALPAFASPANTEPPRDLTLDEYRAELRRIQSEAALLKDTPSNSIALFKSIADRFRVTSNGQQFLIDNKPLKDAIGEYNIAKAERRGHLLDAMNARLQILQDEADQFVSPASTQARRKLDEVLSRRQFRGAKGPTLIETWSQKIQDWIARFLMKLFGKIPSKGTRNDTLAWILIAVAICVLAIWIKRTAGRREPESVRIPIPFAPSAKGWRTWLAEARSAAAENRWRDAVHLAYWAGISNLEENGAWIPDRARTPREYLRLISASHPNHAELSALTRRFEPIWYGNAEAGASDFSEALRHLEVLGCR